MLILSRCLGLFALAAWLALPACAQDKLATPAEAKPAAQDAKGDAQPSDTAVVKQLFESKFPGLNVREIVKSPFFGGLYEIFVDDRMVYTDAKVAYILVGSVYDANNKTNLSEQRIRKLTRVAIDTLPLNIALKKVKGDGTRTLVVFADADCPFCKRLEDDLRGLDNVTIYTFLLPLDQLHPDAAKKSARIWCSADKVKAWDDWFEKHTLPDNKGECETPIAQTAELGQKLRVSATPTLIFADGSIVPGALPLDRLKEEINNAEAEAKK